MATTDVSSITTALADLIGDQLQAVTFKWVARHFNIPYDTSKRVLFDFLTKQGQKVRASFLLSGWTSDDTPRHVVRVVDGGGLEDAKAAMSVITALHVYSVQPSALKDVNKLQNSDYAQTEELFRKMMASAADPSPLSTNLLSTVRYFAAKRDASLVRPAPKKPPSSAVAAPSKASAPAKSAAPAPSAPKPSIFAASSKASQGKVKASTAAAVGSTKSNPQETKKPAAASKKPSNAPAAVLDDDDDDDDDDDGDDDGDDEEMPAVSRPTKGKRVTIDDSESEEDAPPAKQAKVEKKSASAAAKSTKGGAGAGGKRKKETEEEKEEVEKPSEPAPKYGTVKVHIDAPSGKRTRRVMKSYFNDAGEEVTEMVDETDDEAPPPSTAAAPSAPAPARAPAPKPAQSSKPSGGSKKGGKGAAAAGQRSIASFFGKS